MRSLAGGGDPPASFNVAAASAHLDIVAVQIVSPATLHAADGGRLPADHIYRSARLPAGKTHKRELNVGVTFQQCGVTPDQGYSRRPRLHTWLNVPV